MPESPQAREPIRQWLRRELPQIALMLGLLLAARDTLANHYQVPSGSMRHTLQVGDRVAVDMRAYGLRLPFTQVTLLDTGTPARGDIAVFDSPVDGERLIKRVVAVAGDTVELRDGRLRINGVALAAVDGEVERFGRHRAALDLAQGGGPDIAPRVIPKGQVLMLGDARGNSLDGRYFGLVRASSLYGRATAVYYRRGEGLAWRAL
jgi:signal peptidase I